MAGLEWGFPQGATGEVGGDGKQTLDKNAPEPEAGRRGKRFEAGARDRI
jgi:hypothetical protein